jgi:hypothetical protein
MVRGCKESQSGVPLRMRGFLQLIVDDGLVSIECLRSEILWGSVKDTMSCSDMRLTFSVAMTS